MVWTGQTCSREMKIMQINNQRCESLVWGLVVLDLYLYLANIASLFVGTETYPMSAVASGSAKPRHSAGHKDEGGGGGCNWRGGTG